jgi:hypothetical protein
MRKFTTTISLLFILLQMNGQKMQMIKGYCGLYYKTMEDLYRQKQSELDFYRFQPGQFNMLYAHGVGEAAISISGDPADRARLIHTIRAVGKVSEALTPLRDRGAVVVLRSGCYLTHDNGFYEQVSPDVDPEWRRDEFDAAIEVWGRVLSRPEPALALPNLGRRDVSFDMGLPKPMWTARDGQRSSAPRFDPYWPVSCFSASCAAA